ncbi:MAG: hypothetical protein GX417_08295 [Clostridiales bacterium]|nr:hypothetical protein [Clostridiales bacterium]
MKRNRSLLIALLTAALLLAACTGPAAPEPTAAPAAETPSPAVTTAQSPAVTPTELPTPTEPPAPTPTAIATPEPTPTPQSPRMYSSYADLVSFDPDTGVAKFDYFDMLRGEDAVAFLVDHEGYSLADAQELVDNFADSEYVKKNTNPQLREIDLDDVSLSLMVQTSGEFVEGATPVPSNASDFRAIYALDPTLLTNTYFYYITVESDGRVSLVEQVYWP